MPPLPLVSIGLPVYNGMPHLRAAIESLLKQTYSNIEILISDNASTDGTREYCRALAEVHPHVRYVRNSENVGPLENFRRALARARGEYFMWAAHDDKWSDRFVSGLVESLLASADAVLATPTTIHIREDGTLCSEPPDRPATGQSDTANLKLLFDDHASSWIYGLWRGDWLQQHFAEFLRLPLWGGDVLWLTDICQRCKITGNQEAIIYKRRLRSRHGTKNAAQAVAYWAYMFRHITTITVRNTHGRKRVQTLLLSWRYIYRLCIRRPHLLRTAWRVVRMVTWAAITSIPPAVVRVGRRLARGLPSALDYAARRHI